MPLLALGKIERIKLVANAFDRGSTSCFTIGIATPAAGYVYNIANFGAQIDVWRLVLGIIAWLIAGLVLNYLARRTLSELDQ